MINAYPNPTSQLVTIKSLTESQIMSFELFDIAGKKVHSELNKDLSKEIKYDTNTLVKGVYLLKALLSDGNRASVKLIIN